MDSTEKLDFDGVWQKILVGASARDLAKQIEVPEGGCKREVEPALERRCRRFER